MVTAFALNDKVKAEQLLAECLTIKLKKILEDKLINESTEAAIESDQKRLEQLKKNLETANGASKQSIQAQIDNLEIKLATMRKRAHQEKANSGTDE